MCTGVARNVRHRLQDRGDLTVIVDVLSAHRPHEWIKHYKRWLCPLDILAKQFDQLAWRPFTKERNRFLDAAKVAELPCKFPSLLFKGKPGYGTLCARPAEKGFSPGHTDCERAGEGAFPHLWASRENRGPARRQQILANECDVFLWLGDEIERREAQDSAVVIGRAKDGTGRGPVANAVRDLPHLAFGQWRLTTGER